MVSSVAFWFLWYPLVLWYKNVCVSTRLFDRSEKLDRRDSQHNVTASNPELSALSLLDILAILADEPSLHARKELAASTRKILVPVGKEADRSCLCEPN